MPRHLPGLALWLAIAAPAACALAAETPPADPAAITIAYAEQPPRLLRDTSFYSAVRGVALRGNDILATHTGVAQFDAGGSTVAMGPASRVWLRNDGELVLLDGWLKVRGRPQRPVRVATAQLRITSAGATATLHAIPGTTDVFAESGELPVELLIKKTPSRTTIPAEQFAVAGNKGLRVAPRPSPAFINAMPGSFRDALVPVTFRGAAVAPSRERTASYAELAPWLSGQPGLRQAVQRRFDPPRARRAAAVRPSTDQPSTISHQPSP